MIQQIRLRRRKINNNVVLPSNIPLLLRRIYTSRGIQSAMDLDLSIDKILPWQQINGIKKAINMLYEAFCANIHIVIVGDFDVDGATSTALIVLCLWSLGYYNITYILPNRFEDNYGLSPRIVNLAYTRGAQMIVTVDNGMSSHDGIELAQQLGISVLITDHHLPGKKLPNAKVIVNPNLHDCYFPSKSLTGVGVVFYLMLALRELLHDKGWFTLRGITVPNLAEYLDLVALGTVADVAPLDINNRILIWQGLCRIRTNKCRPGIKALLEIANISPKILASSDLGFVLVPLLNAAGRLDDISISVALLLCDNFDEARILAKKINKLNQSRKKIERKMIIEAIYLCEKLEYDNRTMPNSIVIYYPEWHQGVIGVLASHIKERFHRPVIIFAQIDDNILKGSCRSIQGFHIYDALEYLNILYPELIIKFGGHMMAAGLFLRKTKLNEFQYLFDDLVTKQIDLSLLKSEIISDGSLSPTEMTIEVAQMICDAGPWGQMFPEPLFDGYFYLLRQQIICKYHLKVTVKPINGGPLLNGIAFNIDTKTWPNNDVRKVGLAYKLNINKYCGNRSLQIIINNIWPI